MTANANERKEDSIHYLVLNKIVTSLNRHAQHNFQSGYYSMPVRKL